MSEHAKVCKLPATKRALGARSSHSAWWTLPPQLQSQYNPSNGRLDCTLPGLLPTFLKSSPVSVSSLKLTTYAAGAHCLRRSLNILGV